MFTWIVDPSPGAHRAIMGDPHDHGSAHPGRRGHHVDLTEGDIGNWWKLNMDLYYPNLSHFFGCFWMCLRYVWESHWE